MSGGLRVTHDAGGTALLRFGFGAGVAADIEIGCPRLDGADTEAWLAPGVESVPVEGAWLRRVGDLAMLAIEVDEIAAGGIEAATARAYRGLIAQVRASPHPFLLRIWTYLDDINAGEGDEERYRRFCVGRAAAVDERFHAPPPAATAIGTAHRTGRVQVIALCTREPGLALENPRQTPAWQYPREFGPVSPGFSRGALLQTRDGLRLLASGTASIVGHVSRHPGDAAAQLRESLANLDALLREGERHGGRFALQGCEALRVYLRDPGDLAAVRAALAPHLPLERVLLLHGDICRRELQVELEGVFVAG